MTWTKENTRRIDAMMCDATGEVAPAHLIGHTTIGKKIYAWIEGWSPVAMTKDGAYFGSTGYRLNADGHYVI